MTQLGITKTLFFIALIGGFCLIASMMVLGLVSEREGRFADAKREIASGWSERQTLAGPMLIIPGSDPKEDFTTFVLPKTLTVKSTLVPEVRSRGIFHAVVYTSEVEVSGTFSRTELRSIAAGKPVTLGVLLTDTKGIEAAIPLEWDGASAAFAPGPGLAVDRSSGFHAVVSAGKGDADIPFSFVFSVKGSEGISVAPLGDETSVTVSSVWPSPKFSGEFLPVDRSITAEGFTATWKISSFGRSYPGTWKEGDVSFDRVLSSVAGVDLYETLDPYDPVVRSIKYAVLFIVMSFAAFFLFDVRSGVRIHPVSYLLVGAALALFYLLLLSLTEQIGFAPAYLIAALLTVSLVSGYSAAMLRDGKRAIPVALLLSLLYGYLYFVLQLEDYALLFGAFLLFAFLAFLMFATRKIDWFELDGRGRSAE